MHKPSSYPIRFTFLLSLSLSSITLLPAATSPGISLLKTIDLSPGIDTYFPFQLAVNHTTRKIYVPGSLTPDGTTPPPDGGVGYGVKVIDAATNTALAGVPLGFYTEGMGEAAPFQPVAIALDESAGPTGNKIYVVGQVGDNRLFLRKIDGATDTNLTGEGIDLLLPIAIRDSGHSSIAINSTNHKVYVCNQGGDVAVVDGPSNSVITVLSSLGGFDPHVLVANPIANKVFLFASNSFVVVIDSTNDSHSSFSSSYSALDATFDSVNDRIFVLGYKNSSLDPELVAIDATTGAEINSTSALSEDSNCVAVDSAAGMVYVGAPSKALSPVVAGDISTFSATTLSSTTSYAIGAGKLAFAGSGPTARLYLIDNNRSEQAPSLRNSVGILDPVTGKLDKLTVGYTPGQIAINPKTNRIYIADLKAPEVVVLDGTNDTILKRVPVAPRDDTPPVEYANGFRPLEISIDRNRFYITHTAQDTTTGIVLAYVDEYDGETDSLVKSILVNSDTSAGLPQMVVDDTRHRLYVKGSMIASPPGSFLKLYDLIDDSELGSAGFFYSNDMALDPISGRIYVAGGYLESVTIYDPIAQESLGTVPTGMVPGDVTVNSRTGRAFAVDQVLNTVTVISGTESEATIKGSANEVRSVAVDDLTNSVFLGGYSFSPDSKGWVSVFDGNNNYASKGQIEVGRYPYRMTFNTATRQLFVSNDTEGTVSILQSDTAAKPDRLANISTRLGVETDDNVLIGGFIIAGPAGSTKQVLIRGIGPSLTALGVTGALADPFLEMHSGPDTIATNDNWKVQQNGKSQQAAIEGTTIPPMNDLESAILINLAPGSYTAVMRGVNNDTGVGLVEAYDLTANATTKMVNISTRGRVDTGDNVMIGGVILTGASPSRIILRAIGPSLTDSGVVGALQDPVLELHNDQGALITANDNWKDDNQGEIEATGIPPADDRESAIVATLYPSSYTAIVRGKDNTTGVGLVEAYYLP